MKSFFKLLEPEDDPDRFSAAACFKRVKNAKIGLSESWESENAAKIQEKVVTTNRLSEENLINTKSSTEQQNLMPTFPPQVCSPSESSTVVVDKTLPKQDDTQNSTKSPGEIKSDSLFSDFVQPLPSPKSSTSCIKETPENRDGKDLSIDTASAELTVFGDSLNVYERAAASKNVNTKNYDAEWKRFITWVDKHGQRWGVTTQEVVDSSLSSSAMDYLMAEYVSNRHNLTAKRREQVIVRLDPNTIGPLVSRLCSMVARITDYR